MKNILRELKKASKKLLKDYILTSQLKISFSNRSTISKKNTPEKV